MSKPDGSLIFDTKLKTEGFEKGVDKVAAAAKAAAATVTAAAGAAAVAIVNYGSQMETGMAKVRTMVSGSADAVQASLGQISASLIATSNATGQSASGLAEAAYQALSAGVAAADAAGFVDKAAKLAIGGFTTTESAVDVLSSVINAYGSDVIDADKASKILMQTQNKGKTTIDELAASLSQCTPTAAALGVSFEQVGASLAVITAKGTPTATATTQLNQLMAELGKSGTVASDNLAAAAKGTEYAGKSFSQLAQEGVPLSDVLNLMGDYAARSGKSMIDMFSSIDAGKAALSLASQGGKTFSDDLAAMSTQADVVSNAYDAMMDTFEGTKNRFVSTAQNIAITAYDSIKAPLKDAMRTAIQWMEKAQKFISTHGAEIADVLQKLGKAAVVAGSAFAAFKTVQAVGGVVQGVATQITAATAALKAAKVAVTAGTTAFKLLNLAWVASPAGVVAAGVALLTAAVIAATLASRDNLSAQREELKSAQALHDAAARRAQDYADMCADSASASAASESQMEHTSELASELMHLTDATGKVKDADAGRAQFILGQLNDALGTEYSMTDGIINQYDELKQSVQKLIEAKRAETMLSAWEDDYKTALAGRAAAMKEVGDAYVGMQQAQAEVDDITAQHLSELTQLEQVRAETGISERQKMAAEQNITMQGWYAELQVCQETLDTQSAAYDQARATADGYYGSIGAYEQAAALIQQGDTAQAVALMDQKNAAYASSTQTMAQSSAEQQAIATSNYASQLAQLNYYLQQYNAGMDGYSAEGLQAMQESAQQAGDAAEAAGVTMVNGQITGIDGRKQDLTNTIQSLADNGITVLGTKVPDFTAKGRDGGQGYVNGLRQKKIDAYNAGYEIAQAAMNGIAAGQKSKSPSRVAREKGRDGGEGYRLGIADEAPAVGKTAAELSATAMAGLAPLQGARFQQAAAEFGAQAAQSRTAVFSGITGTAAASAGAVERAAGGTGTALQTGSSTQNINVVQANVDGRVLFEIVLDEAGRAQIRSGKNPFH